MATASIKVVKEYFEFTSMVEMKREWEKLSDEEKDYFKTACVEALAKGWA